MTKKASEVDSNNVDPSTPEATKTKVPRFHVVRGISYPVIRSYYDPRQNVVIDVVEVAKTVPSKFGEPRKVTVNRHILCNDADLQARYKRKEEVTEVVDV